MEVNRKREEYEAAEKDQSQSQGRDVQLEDNQV